MSKDSINSRNPVQAVTDAIDWREYFHAVVDRMWMVILCMVLICVGVALLCVFMFFYITFLLPRVQNDIIVATGTTIGYFVLVGLLIWSLLTSLSDTYASGKK